MFLFWKKVSQFSKETYNFANNFFIIIARGNRMCSNPPCWISFFSCHPTWPRGCCILLLNLQLNHLFIVFFQVGQVLVDHHGNTTIELDERGKKILRISSPEASTANLTLKKPLDREVISSLTP
jgi:hypothetical protein